MSSQHFDVVKNQVAAYEREVEEWKSDHDLSVKCMDFESLLNLGLQVLAAIDWIDETWRHRVRLGQFEYDAAVEDVLTNLYTLWLKPCDRMIQTLDEFERAGFRVEYSSRFKAACREVTGILTDDSEFFQGDKLVALRDSAIDAHRENTCEPCSPTE